MAARAIWKGRIRFGGVDVPVKLYSAVQDRSIHFRLLDAERNEPISQKMVNPATGDVVPSEEIRRAFETEDGDLLVLEEEELEGLEPEPSREIEVVSFAPAGAVTHQWFERPYYLGPDGSPEEYFTLAEALRRKERIGIARWVMRKKDYIGALGVEGDYLILITLRSAGEVVPASALRPPAGRALEKREVAMAKQLIDAMADEFDIAAFRDEYRDRVLELVEAKAEGKIVKFPTAPRKRPEKSLTEVLERSLAAAKQERASA